MNIKSHNDPYVTVEIKTAILIDMLSVYAERLDSRMDAACILGEKDQPEALRETCAKLKQELIILDEPRRYRMREIKAGRAHYVAVYRHSTFGYLRSCDGIAIGEFITQCETSHPVYLFWVPIPLEDRGIHKGSIDNPMKLLPPGTLNITGKGDLL